MKTVIGILAHVDAGKTTLSESLLFESGMIRKKGRVDTKDAFLDNNDIERERGITVYSKEARINYEGKEFILLDTPGHIDFSAEMERTISVLDMAIILISAPNGVEAHTKTVWKICKEARIPVIIFANKTDLLNDDRETVFNKLKKELGGGIVDFNDFRSPIFYENVASESEELMDEYFNKGTVSDENIYKAIANRSVVPVLFGSALKSEGVKELMDLLCHIDFSSTGDDEFAAVCYKITRDNKGNRLSHFKVSGGKLSVKDLIDDEKVNEIRLYSGEKYTTAKEACENEICVIPGLTKTFAGKAYGALVNTRRDFCEPVLTYKVSFDNSIDMVEMLKHLKELEEEDPKLYVEYVETLHEIHVMLMGEVQTEVLKKRIKDRYDIDVEFVNGSIRYKETIKDTVEGVGHFEPLRHYAEVHLRMEPLPNDSGLKFESEVSEDLLDRNWQRLILTHLGERVHTGVLTNSPITDMKITLVAGRAHQKHTEGGDFRQATYRAIRQGLMQAQSVLLEPYYNYSLTLPNECVGRAMTDLDRMLGTAIVSETHEGTTVLVGRVPVSEINGYSTKVMEYTSGKGFIEFVPAGYFECHNADEVIASKNYNPDSDLRNPSGSVFCMHGSGTQIPWNEVCDYMHLPFSYEEEKEDKPLNVRKSSLNDMFLSVEEVDAIINKTANANKKADSFAYKGVSSALRDKQRNVKKVEPKEVVYKGSTSKERYLLVDGYNVIHASDELSELAKASIDGAAGRLADWLCNYQGLTGEKIILVYDAYKVPGNARKEYDYYNIHIVYTKTAETADHYIERYSHENAKKYDICVATSDGVEQVIIRGAGARLISSRELLRDIKERSQTLDNPLQRG